jgi:hypothetical protein
VIGIYDDNNNVWQRLLDGSDAGLTGRVEIWCAFDARPVTDISIFSEAGNERALAVLFTEWSGLATASPVVGLNAEPAAMSTMPTTGTASVAAPGLVIAATSFGGAPIAATLATADFTPFVPFTHTNVTGAAAYRVVGPHDYVVQWQLSESRYHTGGIVALRVE